jgi:hypothetical protein
MKRLQDNGVIEKCLNCDVLDDYYKYYGEPNYCPLIQQKIDPDKIHPACPLPQVEVITDKDSIDYMVCVPEVYIEATESIEKIIIVRKAKE